MLQILLGFPVESLDQKLTILCLMVNAILDLPSSPKAMLFAVLGLGCSIYLQKVAVHSFYCFEV